MKSGAKKWEVMGGEVTGGQGCNMDRSHFLPVFHAVWIVIDAFIQLCEVHLIIISIYRWENWVRERVRYASSRHGQRKEKAMIKMIKGGLQLSQRQEGWCSKLKGSMSPDEAEILKARSGGKEEAVYGWLWMWRQCEIESELQWWQLLIASVLF